MYDTLNMLAGLFFLATIASLIYIIVKAIKKQFKKSLLLIPVVLFVIYLVICVICPEKPTEKEQTNQTVESQSTEVATTEPETMEQATESSSVEETSVSMNNISNENFITDVKSELEGQVGENEAITDIVLQNKNLCIFVDLSEKDPSPLTLEDLALSRVSSITDAILELEDYDELWNTITVDFGELGKVENGKDNMKENEYGGRYFSSENFVFK